jgi:hypothetical protein
MSISTSVTPGAAQAAVLPASAAAVDTLAAAGAVRTATMAAGQDGEQRPGR